jgi:hypothetical protein
VRITIVMMFGWLVAAVAIPAFAQAGAPSNFVSELSLSYNVPGTGERVECGADCRRFDVPAGVELEIRVQVLDQGGSADGDGVTWDLWINQPTHPFPGYDAAPCRDTASGRYDRACWQTLVNGVDREEWDSFKPDAVCVPGFNNGTCRDSVVRVMMDPDFEGARRRGVYHIAVWVNRLSLVPEEDEFDNFAGPVRVTVEPRQDGTGVEPAAPAGSADAVTGAEAGAALWTDSPAVVIPLSARPYAAVVVPEELETPFTLTSPRSQGVVTFVPGHPGRINVEVTQIGMVENMVVQVRNVSTGEVVAEAQGKGRLRLDGSVDSFDLRGDRSLEVVVTPGQGSRGIRGTVRVTYPAHIRYMVDPANRE